jgi:hypothetical protein
MKTIRVELREVTSVKACKLAPLARRSFTVSTWFSCDAMYSGVKPF